MYNRTCPWKLDNGSICSAPPKDYRHRMGLCELHSSVQYMTQLHAEGRLLNEVRVMEHTPGFTYVALTSDGNYHTGWAGTWDLLLSKLKKAFKKGDLTKVVALLDGGKSQYLSVVGSLSPFWIEGRNSTYSPDAELPDLPQSNRYSDLPRNMQGLGDLFTW
ncbi:hypothetical protein [Streptomyces sp. uw30]|uniref:hypothetical protein n=1 Tax=Streptomyces sp. uw30 TaxID=1828179 RepID=UPI0011CDE205|nr:hypothetical protein [Streptomyces sp. uw30]